MAKTIVLDFLGKDSVADHRELNVPDWIAEEFETLLKNKKSTDKVFDKADSATTSELLKTVDPEFTNKLFRTAQGCGLLAESLQSKDWDNLSDKEFKLKMNECQLEVAKKLNHHSAVDKKTLATRNEKDKERIKAAKVSLESKKYKFEEANEKLDTEYGELQTKIEEAKVKAKPMESGDPAKKALKDKIKKWEERCEAIKTKKKENREKVEKAIKDFTDLKASLNFKIGLGDISLGTSLTNYSSPEIIFSVCNYAGKDPKLVYTPALLKKFDWAKDTGKEFFKNYPTLK